MDLSNLSSGNILAGILTIVTGLVSTYLLKYKGKLGQVITLGHEVVDLADQLQLVISDNKVTKEEIESLKQELSEVILAWKQLTGKA